MFEEPHLSRYNELNYNMMHCYNFGCDSSKWEGGFFDDISVYKDTIKNRLTSWYGSSNNNSMIYSEKKS